MAELERQAVQEQEEILKELEELKTARQQIDEARKVAEARVGELEKLVEDQQAALVRAKDQLGGVGGKVAELEKQLDAIAKDNKKLDKTLEAANQQNEQLAAELAGAEAALADSEARASKLESRSESEKKALAKAHAALGALMEQLGPPDDA
jgi:chromosome segregation ATPase